MTGKYEYLRIELDGRIANLTLNRPQRLNAVHQPAAFELKAAAQELDDNPDIRLVAIRGEGRAFSTGIDLKDLAVGGIDMRYFRVWEEALRLFETMDKLVLCQIHGHAVGGGLQLAMACDIRAATADANLSVPAINEGLLPGLGTFRLARYVGHGRAKRMVLSGEGISGAEGMTIGLVDHLLPADGMEAAFEALIEKYMAVNSKGCRLSKLAVNDCFDLEFDPFLERYMDLQQQAFDSEDFKEAIDAYHAKRRPAWG